WTPKPMSPGANARRPAAMAGTAAPLAVPPPRRASRNEKTAPTSGETTMSPTAATIPRRTATWKARPRSPPASPSAGGELEGTELEDTELEDTELEDRESGGSESEGSDSEDSDSEEGGAEGSVGEDWESPASAARSVSAAARVASAGNAAVARGMTSTAYGSMTTARIQVYTEAAPSPPP